MQICVLKIIEHVKIQIIKLYIYLAPMHPYIYT